MHSLVAKIQRTSQEIQQRKSNSANSSTHNESSCTVARRTAHNQKRHEPLYLPLAAPMGYFTRGIAPEHWDCFWAHVANLQDWPMRESAYKGYSVKVSRREAMMLVEVSHLPLGLAGEPDGECALRGVLEALWWAAAAFECWGQAREWVRPFGRALRVVMW
jgi:hypothetical protein